MSRKTKQIFRWTDNGKKLKIMKLEMQIHNTRVAFLCNWWKNNDEQVSFLRWKLLKMRRRSVVVPLTTKPTLRNFVCVYWIRAGTHRQNICEEKFVWQSWEISTVSMQKKPALIRYTQMEFRSVDFVVSGCVHAST